MVSLGISGGSDQLPAVLVVEDEVLILISTAQDLRDAGFEVYEAINAAEAIALLERHPEIGLLFTDIDMPGAMDGLMLSRLVGDRWPPVKIIVTSGKALGGRTGMPPEGLFMPKPYRLDKLITTIHDMVA